MLPTTLVTPESDIKVTPWSFQLVTDFRELQALAPAWRQLHAQSAAREPMLEPDWLLTWWEVYGQNSGRKLCVGVLHEGKQLVGLAPLCRRRVWYHRTIPFTRLEFLGADVDQDDGVCSAYLDFLAAAGQETQVAEAFCEAIAAGSFGEWHETVLEALNGADGTPDRFLTAFGKTGYHGTQETITESPYVRLPTSWDAYLQSLSHKHRRYIKGTLKDFEAWAGTDWKVEIAQTPPELTQGRQILERLHQERWQEVADQGGCFTSPRFAAFHHAYMAQILHEGKLELSWLTVRGEPIAVYYQILTNKKVYFYMCGRSMQVPPRIRPGIVLNVFCMQKAIAEGRQEYDFLRGLAQYKMAFTRTTRAIVKVRIARPGLREWVRGSVQKTKEYLRRLRHSFRTARPQ